MSEMTNIPDPSCDRCDGVGWYEGGEAIKTNCDCLRLCQKAQAEAFVVNGSIADWERLYATLI